jgi:hypothetical protein
MRPAIVWRTCAGLAQVVTQEDRIKILVFQRGNTCASCSELFVYFLYFIH